MKIHCRWLLPIAAASFLISTASVVKATPYASCITNNNGTIQFYLNESGGNVTVTYEDGSTNTSFDGIATGTNVAAGVYSFALSTHTSYNISVYKVGSGVPSVINSPIQNTNGGSGFFIIGNLRGIDVNKNPVSPNFGRVYVCASGRTLPLKAFNLFNADGSFVSSNNAGINWTPGNASSPYRIGVAPDDSLMVGDYSATNCGVFRISPDISTGSLFLGPPGDMHTNGAGAIVHGQVFSRPLLLGPLTNGLSANLMYVDNDLPSSAANSILIFSNITSAALPWENPPDAVGGQVGLNIQYLSNVYPGLTEGTNGYIYTSEQRANYAMADISIFDPSGTTLLWSSLPTLNSPPDYFVTDSGGGLFGLIDSAVSPDDAYLIGMAIDNHYTIASLTNGIPDIRTIYTVAPTSYLQNGRGICWDAADNFYSISSGTAWAQAWTLGLTTTTVTSGNANGTTGFQVIYPANQVSVTASNSFISQPNTYGNPTTTDFVITRSGATTNSVTVNYTFSGNANGATNGGITYPITYTANPPGSVTIGIGQTSAVVAVTSISDSIPRPTTALTITVSPSGAYEAVFPKTASINILNTAPQELFTAVGSPTMYKAFSNDYGSFAIARWGDTNLPSYTVSSFSISGGTGVAGTDYTMPSTVTFHPGDLTNYSYIYPLRNGLPPVDTNIVTYTGNKTIVAALNSAGGYTAVPNTNNFTIVDNGNPSATVLYSDPLTNSVGTNWNVAATDINYPATTPDYFADFGYDLTASARDPFGPPIPFPPNGQKYAMRLTANKNSTVQSQTTYSTAVNLYPTNLTLSGNFAVRFNLNLTEPYVFATQGSYEGPVFGINFSGKLTNWWANNSPSAPAVSGSAQTNWNFDGVWVWFSDSAFSEYSTYNLFSWSGTTNNLPKTIAPLAQSSAATFGNMFKTNIFTSTGSPGVAGNGSPDNGAPISSWADVELKQYNNVVTLSIDKTHVLVYTNTTPFTNGTIMLGYEAPVFGTDGGDGAAYYSNLQIVRLGPPAISQLAYNKGAGTFTFNFSSPDGSVTASQFTVLGSTNLNSGFTAAAGATVSQLGDGTYLATVPLGGPIEFYRVQEQYK